ncbi:hypothetical protein GCM10010104_60060 [Streptomyces indiaensis]|uniref:HNH endonuclease n=1 Tax=Streptomyces indiaensis TaxID=284033 RepID=A0ABP5RCI9_9ACTN
MRVLRPLPVHHTGPRKAIAGAGHDIWWNFVPACKPCNLRKSKHESAAHWAADMDICHRYPELTRSKWRMSPKVFAGITRRVERVQREIADADRREWFELHYGEEKWANKTELFKILDRCKAELKGYPHYPWRTPKVRELKGYCTRLICCGYFHPQARLLHAFLEREEVRAFQRAVFNERTAAEVLTPHTVIPARSPACTPEGASSMTRQSFGWAPSRAMARVMVELSTPEPAGQHVMSSAVAQTHQRGQQPVDEDELVLGPGSHSPLPRPSREPSLMLLVPQRPHLSDNFSDHIRRQPSDPVLRHDQLTRPSPHHAQFNELPERRATANHARGR